MNYARAYFWILISAGCYALAYVCPHSCWWLITLFLLPLFYRAAQGKLTVYDGCIWSVAAFSIHLAGVLQGLFFIAQGPVYVRLIPPLAVLLLACSYGISWFAVSVWLSRYTQRSSYRLVVWTLTTILFFLWMEHACIFLLGRVEGYLFFSPLVPLVHAPALLYFLPWVSSYVTVTVFVLTQASCIGIFLPALFWKIVAACCMLYWSATLFFGMYAPHVSLATHPGVVCSPVVFHAYDNITLNGRVVRDYVKKVVEKKPYTQLLLLPESAIRCAYVMERPDTVVLWNPEGVGKPLTIITGGFRWDDERYRNSVYWVHAGAVRDRYDKRHAMALTERAPSEFFLGRSSFLKNVYFQTMLGVVPHTQPRPVWRVSEDLQVIPYICSELFFNNYPDHSDTQTSSGATLLVVALCNDGWLHSGFMRYQMLMGARYRAMQWQLPIMYVAYHYQLLCSPSGECEELEAVGLQV